MPTGSVTPAGGGTAFNGGTITQELVVDTASGTGQALELQGTRTSQHDVFKIDYPHNAVAIDSDGTATFASDDSMNVYVKGTSDSSANVTVRNEPTVFVVQLASDSGHAAAEVANGSALVAGATTQYGLYTALNAAPATNVMNAGMACIWFDKTDGAAKLMVKGLSANGTAVTAAIALS